MRNKLVKVVSVTDMEGLPKEPSIIGEQFYLSEYWHGMYFFTHLDNQDMNRRTSTVQRLTEIGGSIVMQTLNTIYTMEAVYE